jgi:hypothetical protein
MPFVSHVILTLFGQRYEVLRFRYSFHRATSSRGWPTTGMRGGEIIVDVESTSDVSAQANIFEQGGYPRSVPGSLEVWNRDETHCFRRIEWEEAYIYGVGEAMAKYSWEPMTMRLAISPLRLDFDHTVRIDRRWPQTYGFWWEKYQPKEVKSELYVKPEERYTIDDAYWIDETGNQVRELDVAFPVTLHVVLGKFTAGSIVNLTFKEEDAKKVEYSGTVNAKGIVVLENFKLNR